jgi:pimeloyl-ACP methyl ester carboxylesterase/DNA-binding CsgD family transcriptional regulator
MAPEKVRYARSPDGATLGWVECGKGERTIIVPPNASGGAQDGWNNPIAAPLLRASSAHFRVIRYDQRGFGLSSRNAEHGVELWADDIGAVADAAGCTEPFVLCGGSATTYAAITFAARAPERLSHLLLYGSKANGVRAAGIPELVEHANARREIRRLGWQNNDRGVIALNFAYLVKDLTTEEFAYFANIPLADHSTVENVLAYDDAVESADVRPLLGSIRTPTLVGHARGDEAVDIRLGRKLAQRIPGATFVEIDSVNHILRDRDGSIAAWMKHVLDFVYGARNSAGPMDTLSPREREIMEAICEGLTNDAIAARLGISEKTVRNTLTGVFEKMGVATRTQAVIAAMGTRTA